MTIIFKMWPSCEYISTLDFWRPTNRLPTNFLRVILRRRSSPPKSFPSPITTHHQTPPPSPPIQPTMKLTTRLSRSAIDATRFTATSPHAYSKPSPLRSAASSSTPTPTPSSSRPSPQGPQRRSPNGSKPIPPPPAMPPKGATAGETPAEKVARLRAMRLAEREAQVSQWDKVVVRGRTWADRAHKTTVYFLVTFSGK